MLEAINIARSLLTLEESEQERMRRKFDVCYMMAKESMAFEKYAVLHKLEVHHSVDLRFAYCVPSLLQCIALTNYEPMIVHFRT